MSPQCSGRQVSSAGMSLGAWVVGLAWPCCWWGFTAKGLEGLLVSGERLSWRGSEGAPVTSAHRGCIWCQVPPLTAVLYAGAPACRRGLARAVGRILPQGLPWALMICAHGVVVTSVVTAGGRWHPVLFLHF